MNIRRILFLGLLTVTMAMAGPFARGLSAQAAALLQTAELSRPGAVTSLKAAAAAKRCQRGAVSWSSCDLVTMPDRREIISAGTGKIFNHLRYGTSDELSRSRLFRPPRTG